MNSVASSILGNLVLWWTYIHMKQQWLEKMNERSYHFKGVLVRVTNNLGRFDNASLIRSIGCMDKKYKHTYMHTHTCTQSFILKTFTVVGPGFLLLCGIVVFFYSIFRFQLFKRIGFYFKLNIHFVIWNLYLLVMRLLFLKKKHIYRRNMERIWLKNIPLLISLFYGL